MLSRKNEITSYVRVPKNEYLKNPQEFEGYVQNRLFRRMVDAIEEYHECDFSHKFIESEIRFELRLFIFSKRGLEDFKDKIINDYIESNN